MKCLCFVWDEIGIVTIDNCWRTTEIVSSLEQSADSGMKAIFSEPDVEQSINDMVARIPSRRIPISMLLNCETDLMGSATPPDEDLVDTIVLTVAGNDLEDGSADTDNLQDTPSKMERIGSAVELLSSTARVKRFVMVFDDPHHSLINNLQGLQKSVRSQCLQSMVQTSITHFFH